MCVSDACNDGYYSDILSGVEQANPSLVGDLEIGFDICIPCDEPCAQCSGPGTRIAIEVCQACRYAANTQGTQCVRECDIHTGEKTLGHLWNEESGSIEMGW